MNNIADKIILYIFNIKQLYTSFLIIMRTSKMVTTCLCSPTNNYKIMGNDWGFKVKQIYYIYKDGNILYIQVYLECYLSYRFQNNDMLFICIFQLICNVVFTKREVIYCSVTNFYRPLSLKLHYWIVQQKLASISLFNHLCSS